jgi:hypothetical protein
MESVDAERLGTIRRLTHAFWLRARRPRSEGGVHGQTSKEVPNRTFKTRSPNSLLFRSLRCLLGGEQKETKETENNGEGFEFAVRGISITQLF